MDTLDVQRIKALIRQGEVRPTRLPLLWSIAFVSACTCETFDCTLAGIEDMRVRAYNCSTVYGLPRALS